MSPTHGRRPPGDVAVVTGGGAGIGKATVRRLAADGAQVVVVEIDPASAEGIVTQVRSEYGPDRAVAVVTDVADPDGWPEVAQRARELGGASTLVCNAFACVVADLENTTLADWEHQLRVNLTGTFLAVRSLYGQLADRAGSVVLMSSVHALVGLPRHGAYAASKGGLSALTRQLAVELGPRVRVNAVLPGPIETRTWDDADDDARRTSAAETVAGRFGRPDEVAAVVAFLTSPEASYVTGANLPVDGGWSITKNY